MTTATNRERAGSDDASVSATTPDATVPQAVGAQPLATEHWSLLATRSLTWSEVISRITIQLTVSPPLLW